MASNHDQSFRPLRGGVSIFNPRVGGLGTLGFVATANQDDRWIVSAFHVLAAEGNASPHDGDPIQQPADGSTVAHLKLARSAPSLDLAAALVEADVLAVPEALGIGRIHGARQAIPGMRVLKAGAATGVTEGVVVSASPSIVEIRLPPEFPASYDLTLPGDSGAVWLDRETREIVALHTRGNNGGAQFARGVPALLVLQTLNLRVL